jgi:hypothetical protein
MVSTIFNIEIYHALPFILYLHKKRVHEVPSYHLNITIASHHHLLPLTLGTQQGNQIVMTASAHRLILQHLVSIPSSELSSPFDDDEIRGEFITEVALASSKKSKLQIEVNDRFETKNEYLTPRFNNMRPLLSPITKSAPRSAESRQFEIESRQPLSPNLRCSKDLKRSRPGKAIQSMKLKSLTPTNIATLC